MTYDARNLNPGTKYVVWVTGFTRYFVAECLEYKGKYGVCVLKVLNAGALLNREIKSEDYGVVDVYDETKHGPIETPRG